MHIKFINAFEAPKKQKKKKNTRKEGSEIDVALLQKMAAEDNRQCVAESFIAYI